MVEGRFVGSLGSIGPVRSMLSAWWMSGGGSWRRPLSAR